MSAKNLIVITGPTASGKTDLSIRLANYLQTEIISADSRQFYKALNIGTAKPDAAQLAAAKHHFIDFLEVTDEYNIGKFEADALNVIEKLFEKKDHVILCGGSGLYIKIITEGIDALPDTDPQIRIDLTKEWNEKGSAEILQRLKEADPEYYNIVDLQNKHRVIRAMEIITETGKPFTSFRSNTKKERAFTTHYYSIEIPRELLYERINQRVDQMMKDGLVDEVRSLLPYRTVNALQTVGYREFFDYFDGKISLVEAVEKVKQNTRNYAKRQMTWLRKVDDVTYGSAEEIERLVKSRFQC